MKQYVYYANIKNIYQYQTKISTTTNDMCLLAHFKRVHLKMVCSVS